MRNFNRPEVRCDVHVVQILREARRLIAAGRSPRRVAEKFSVARSTLYQALKR